LKAAPMITMSGKAILSPDAATVDGQENQPPAFTERHG
jgi:hypothetical protein